MDTSISGTKGQWYAAEGRSISVVQLTWKIIRNLLRLVLAKIER